MLELYLNTIYPFIKLSYLYPNENIGKNKNKVDTNTLLNLTYSYKEEPLIINSYYIENLILKNSSIPYYTSNSEESIKVYKVWDIKGITEEGIKISYWNSNMNKPKSTYLLFTDIESITFTYIHWTRTNQIFNYFRNIIRNKYNEDIETNKEYKIKEKDILKLREVCSKVLEVKDKEYSLKYLPTYRGNFFGNYEYNETYYNQLLYTISKIRIDKGEVYNRSKEKEYTLKALW